MGRPMGFLGERAGRPRWCGVISLLIFCAVCVPCAVLPPSVQGVSVFREEGALYVPPYEHEVRMKIRSISGQRIGDAVLRAKHAQQEDQEGSQENQEEREQRSIFEAISPNWWLDQLRSGGVRVERNGWQEVKLIPIDEDYVVQEDDRVRLVIHVHERAAPDVEIPIIYEDENYLAVCKPAGFDVFANPSGGCVKLSVVGILESMGYVDVLPAHRIDKPVSGVLCLARNKKAISRLQRCIKARKVKKTYLARTRGGPNSSGHRITAPLSITTDERGRRIAEVSEEGKKAETVVADVLRRHKDGTSTLVIQLLSGRYHQIRCHLNHMGWPIVNDAVYGGVAELSPELYTGPRAQEMIRQNMRKHCLSCAYYSRVVVTYMNHSHTFLQTS